MRPTILRAAIAAGLLLLGNSPLSSEPVTLVDAAGRDVAVADSSRIVSIGGSVTEILYTLGLDDRVIAVDDTSTWPPEALEEKPSVGYLRALSPEGVLSLGGTLVLAEADAGPRETVELLESASIPFLRVPDTPSLDGIVEKIGLIARATGREAQGRQLADSVRRQWMDVQAQLDTVEEPVRAMFVLSLRDGQVMAAGEGTAAAAVLRYAGARNVFSGFSGYKPVSAESILKASPEAIVMMDRGGDHAVPADELFSHPGIAETQAARSRRLVVMDGQYLLGFGPRTARAVGELAAELYPGLEIGPAGESR